LLLLRPGFAWFSFNGGLAATGATCPLRCQGQTFGLLSSGAKFSDVAS
jgi:hypothetical protein